MHLIVGSQVVEERICLVADVHTLFCEHNQRNAMFHDDYASLSNVDERVTAEYVLPDKTRDTPYSEYLHSGEWETTGATFHYHRGNSHPHVRTETDMDNPGPAKNGIVLGVDLGIENVAVTSTGVFWSTDELNHR